MMNKKTEAKYKHIVAEECVAHRVKLFAINVGKPQQEVATLLLQIALDDAEIKRKVIEKLGGKQ